MFVVAGASDALPVGDDETDVGGEDVVVIPKVSSNCCLAMSRFVLFVLSSSFSWVEQAEEVSA